MSDLKLLLLQVIVILSVSRAGSALFRFIHQPEVVGEMMAGILLGPSLLGRVAPGALLALFPPGGQGPLYALSQVGLILFVFLMGAQMNHSQLRSSARSIVIASFASCILPFVLGGALAWRLHPILGAGAPVIPFVLFVATAISITAFPVLARILSDQGLLKTPVGAVALSCAAVDDVIAWSVLAVITTIMTPEGGDGSMLARFGGLAVYIAAMLGVVRPVLRRLIPTTEKLTLNHVRIILLVLLSSAWIAEVLSVHALFGSFLAGLVMPRSPLLQAELRSRTESLTLAFLLPLFFAYTGLRTSIGLVSGVEMWFYCGLIIAVAIASKLAGSAVALRIGGMPWREALAVGTLVNTRGLVELVILNIGLDLKILTPTLFSMMVVMALVTTFMTTPLLAWVYPRRLQPKEATAADFG